MNTRIVLTLTVTAQLLLSGQAAIAKQPYMEAMEKLDSQAQKFVQAKGYVAVDPETVADNDYYSQKNFPASGSSINVPDANLDPITRAMLLVESKEVSLPHVRYRVTYNMNVSNDVPEAKHDYVEVTRYNLGPSIRNDLQESVAGGSIADLSEFGVGPHVSWRFAMAPVMGIQSDLLYASRKEISDAEAQKADCLGERCLDLIDPLGPDRNWQLTPAPQLAAPVYATRSDLSPSINITRPTRVIEELWALMSGEGMDQLPFQEEKPQFEFVISWNTFGQDVAVSGVAKQSQVMDDSIAQVWSHRFETIDSPAAFGTMYVSRGEGH